MNELSREYRERKKKEVADLVRLVEKAKDNPTPEDKIIEGVESWERGIFEKSNSTSTYEQKIQEKIQSLKDRIRKIDVERERKPLIEETRKVARDEPVTAQTHEEKRVDERKTTEDRKQDENRKKLKERVETLRAPLEECRSILRVLNVFASKNNEKFKDDFVQIFQRTSQVLKNPKMSNHPNDPISEIEADLLQLRNRLEVPLQQVKEQMRIPNIIELLDIDAHKPFGLLERFVEVNGTSRFSERARKLSTNLGGRETLSKKYKTSS